MTSMHPKDEVSSNPEMEPIESRPAPRTEVGNALVAKIDLVRGLFAFLVVAAHSYDACWSINAPSVLAQPELVRRLIGCTLQSGFYWVMGFFVISGYCIQLSVGRQLSAGRFPLGVYLAARFTRIMPLYYAGLLFALVVEVIVSPARPSFYPDGVGHVGFLSQLIFVQRFVETFGAFAPSWTITYELFYYVFFGVIAWVGVRLGIRPAWVGMGLCVAIGGIMECLYLGGEKNAFTLHSGLIFGLGTIWFLGALVAEYGRNLARYRTVRTLSASWPLVLGLAVALNFQGQCRSEVMYLVTGVAFALLLLRFHAVEELRGPTSDVVPSWLGSTAKVVGLSSYPTYLFHGPILLLVASVIARWHLVADWRITWAILVVSGIVPGVALGWVAERPIMAWRASFLKRLKRASDARAESRPVGILEITR